MPFGVSLLHHYWFCRDPKNTNVVENMVKALARVVSTIQLVWVRLSFFSSCYIVICCPHLSHCFVTL